jgi:hypothetical protein
MDRENRIERGDFYEDCRYHPMLCVNADYADDTLDGISLVLGGGLSSCSPTHCGVIPMSANEAIERAVHWDTYARENGLPTYAELVARPDVT